MTKKLYRSCKDAMLGGVAGGVAEYFDIDATLVRLVMALAFLSGFGFVAYLLAWVIIPIDPSCKSTKTAADEIKEKAEKAASEVRSAFDTRDTKSDKPSDKKVLLGSAVLLLGIMLLAQNILGFDFWHNFWPIFLIVAGLMVLGGNFSRK